jgi:signal transduction histidine kinase
VLPCQHGTGRVIGPPDEIGLRRRAAVGPPEGRGSPPGVRLQDDAPGGDAGYGSFVRTNPEVAATRLRPPLTKRLSARHWAGLDYLAGGVFGLILLASIRHSLVAAIEGADGFVPYRPSSLTWPMTLVLVFVAVIAVALRRRRPTLMLGLLLAGSVIVTTLTGPENGGAISYFLPVGYVLFLVAATYADRQAAARVLVAVSATLLADSVLLYLTGGGYLGHGGMVSVALIVIIAWFTGYIVRQRRRYAIRLQDEAASKAVAEERLRIARELHDVVAHSMSVIAVQAGYGQYVIDTQPADARSALGAIQATSREALDEMRRMLGALRQADETGHRDASGERGSPGPAGPGPDADGAVRAGRADGAAGTGRADGAGGSDGADVVKRAERTDVAAPLYPAPGLADLDRLISRTASAGVRVDVTRCGQARELPASIDLSAYRIVQEALTNVVKHARTSSCQVLIGYGQDELVLEVTDNGAGLPAMAAAASHHGSGPAPNGFTGGLAAIGFADGGPAGGGTTLLAPDLGGSGHGIIGMRERVSLLGGEFSAGPLPGYGFQVSAHIPLPPGSAGVSADGA